MALVPTERTHSGSAGPSLGTPGEAATGPPGLLARAQPTTLLCFRVLAGASLKGKRNIQWHEGKMGGLHGTPPPRASATPEMNRGSSSLLRFMCLVAWHLGAKNGPDKCCSSPDLHWWEKILKNPIQASLAITGQS